MTQSSKTNALAAKIAEDLLRDRSRTVDRLCFVCGRHFQPIAPSGDDNTARFCSRRCQDAYDDCAQRYADLPAAHPAFDRSWHIIAGPDPGYLPQPMRSGRHGFLTICAGCGREFDSCGLRFCSTDCERQHRRRNETATLMQSVGMELPSKRKCAYAGCGGDIPNWRGEGNARAGSEQYPVLLAPLCRKSPQNCARATEEPDAF